jgi:hypothetical protein
VAVIEPPELTAARVQMHNQLELAAAEHASARDKLASLRAEVPGCPPKTGPAWCDDRRRNDDL